MTNPLDNIKPLEYKWKDTQNIYGLTARPLPAFMVQDLDQLTQPRQNNSNITFNTGGGTEPILRIAEDGFYVRGVKVPADENEAAAVYKAFKRFMIESELRRSW